MQGVCVWGLECTPHVGGKNLVEPGRLLPLCLQERTWVWGKWMNCICIKFVSPSNIYNPIQQPPSVFNTGLFEGEKWTIITTHYVSAHDLKWGMCNLRQRMEEPGKVMILPYVILVSNNLSMAITMTYHRCTPVLWPVTVSIVAQPPQSLQTSLDQLVRPSSQIATTFWSA